tara:strand:+ start:2143 stop:2589 length:447 start_codon:yes stop_codon:yes gene_type:complete
MVAVAQLVRAAGCGPAGRGFESLRSPILKPFWLNWIEHWISAPGVTGSNPVEGTMNYFNKIYKLLWIFLIFLIMYLSFQRNIKTDGNHQEVVSAFSSSPILSIVTIIFIILLTSITVLRALESRNEWRRIAAEDKVSKKINKIEQQKK